MKPEEYQSAAARTMASDTLDGKNHALAAWSLGFVTEIGELLDECDKLKGYPTRRSHEGREKCGAEFGDVMWYVAATCTQLDLPFADVLGTAIMWEPLAVDDPLRVAARLGDELKKISCHGHPVKPNEVADKLAHVVALCFAYAEARGLRGIKAEVPSLLALNVEKLQARFPEGFTADASKNRDKPKKKKKAADGKAKDEQSAGEPAAEGGAEG